MEEYLNPETSSLIRLSQKFLEAQARENNGRGIPTIRHICTYLESGDLNAARRLASHDMDKLSEYPHIKEMVVNNLLEGKEFWNE